MYLRATTFKFMEYLLLVKDPALDQSTVMDESTTLDNVNAAGVLPSFLYVIMSTPAVYL